MPDSITNNYERTGHLFFKTNYIYKKLFCRFLYKYKKGLSIF